MMSGENFRRVLAHFFRPDAIHLAAAFAGVGKGGGAIRAQPILINHARNAFRDFLQAAQRLGLRLLGLLAFRDVEMAAHHAHGLAGGVAEEVRAGENPAPRAVAMAHPKLRVIKRPEPRPIVAHGSQGALAIFRMEPPVPFLK